MRPGEQMTEEHKAALREGREKARLARGVQPTEEGSATDVLHIGNPTKWQMKVRLHLESLDDDEAEIWMEGYRLIYEMAGKLCRDQFARRTDGRCYICNRPFIKGVPAGEAGWYDGDNNYRRIRCCDNSEYARLMEIAHKKTLEVRNAAEEAEEASRKALIAVRQASRIEKANRELAEIQRTEGIPVGDHETIK